VPELEPRLVFYWNAFWTLHSSRQAGFGGAMPIQISEIAAYCGLCGFDDPIIRHDLMTMVMAMDAEWLDLETERQKAVSKINHLKGQRGR